MLLSIHEHAMRWLHASCVTHPIMCLALKQQYDDQVLEPIVAAKFSAMNLAEHDMLRSAYLQCRSCSLGLGRASQFDLQLTRKKKKI